MRPIIFIEHILNNFFEGRAYSSVKKKSKRYFKLQKKQINANLQLMDDEKSRLVYLGMIKYRCQYGKINYPGSKTNEMFVPEVTPAQYFIPEVTCKLKKSTFIDCGGYNGDTVTEFAKIVNNDYRKIVVFEPNADIMPELKANTAGLHDVSIIEKGVWSSEKVLKFQRGDSSSKITVSDKESCVTISVVPIDNVEECRDASFIKMDLEGSEWEALHGAEQTIKRNKPLLAICIYHSNEDMVRLIPYIHEIVPEYRIIVRQHSAIHNETVVYAIP